MCGEEKSHSRRDRTFVYSEVEMNFHFLYSFLLDWHLSIFPCVYCSVSDVATNISKSTLWQALGWFPGTQKKWKQNVRSTFIHYFAVHALHLRSRHRMSGKAFSEGHTQSYMMDVEFSGKIWEDGSIPR